MKKNHPGTLYHILIKESLPASAASWLGDVTLFPLENGETLLAGRFIDQAALRGFLNQLWDFNLTVLSVQRSEA